MKLVIFDVDGTLVDSQAHILAAMSGAFEAHGLPVPPQAEVLGIVGLSLPEAMARLAPERPDLNAGLVEAYKASFVKTRAAVSGDVLHPLFPGAAEALAGLRGQDEVLLGIATGKSRRGLDPSIAQHGWQGWFQTIQTADHHPSKPHPSMIEACLSEMGMDAGDAVMVGDTTFDLEMARAAGVAGIGVAWGNHPPQHLNPVADYMLDDWAGLAPALAQLWGSA